MRPSTFAEQNCVFAENQPEYQPLPAYNKKDRLGTVVFCWRLTWRERLQVLLTGKVWHSVLTFRNPLQPQLLAVQKPEMPSWPS